MSGSSISGGDNNDGGQRWAALDSRNERVIDASDPLLLELTRDRADADRTLKAAS